MESELYKLRSVLIVAGIKKVMDETLAGLGLEVLAVPFGEGIRIILMRPEKRGVTPIATACSSSLETPLKDIVHGLWGNLCVRSKDEVRHLRSALKLEHRKLLR